MDYPTDSVRTFDGAMLGRILRIDTRETWPLQTRLAPSRSSSGNAIEARNIRRQTDAGAQSRPNALVLAVSLDKTTPTQLPRKGAFGTHDERCRKYIRSSLADCLSQAKNILKRRALSQTTAITAVPIRGLRVPPSCENYFGAIKTRIESEPRPAAAESRNRQNRNPVCDPDSDSGSDPKLSARGAASSDSVAIAETNANPVCHSNAIFNTHPDVLYFLSPSLKLT
jgi:hypothetical protein